MLDITRINLHEINEYEVSLSMRERSAIVRLRKSVTDNPITKEKVDVLKHLTPQ